MSDENASADSTPDGPTTQSQNPPAAKAKTPRSPVERAIVWGVIGVGLIIGAIQGVAYYGFKNSFADIDDFLDRTEAGATGDVLNLDAAEKLMTGFWSKSELKESGDVRYVVYKWSGVYTSYRLLLHLGMDKTNPMVFAYETNVDMPDHDQMQADLVKRSFIRERELGNAPPPDRSGGGRGSGAPVDETGNSDAPSSGTSGDGNGGSAESGPEGPGAGHRQSIDWASLDKDEDGKISKEEAPEFMQRFFDRIDTDGDGFIDDEERAEMERRRAARQAAGNEDGQEGGPQHSDQPDSDSESDPKSSTTTTPEQSDKPALQP